MKERGNVFYRFLDRYLGIPLSYLTSVMRLPYLSRKVSIPPSRIAVLSFGAIGDLLLLSALLKGLKKIWPHTELELLISNANRETPMLLPDPDRWFVFPVWNFWAMLRLLRKRKYDLLIDANQWCRFSSLLCNLSGVACTVGFNTPGELRAWGYNLTVQHRKDQHEVKNFLALGRVLVPDFPDERPNLSVPADRQFLSPQIASVCQKIAKKNAIFLHFWPSGYKSFLKCWPEEHWTALCQILLRHNFVLCLTGSHSQKLQTENFIANHFKSTDDILSLAGLLSLTELAYLLQNYAKAVVSVNTGIMHLASLLEVPTVALHGPTNPLRWGPLGVHSVSLLPQAGHFAYLNLGFEYPCNAVNPLSWLPVENVSRALMNFF